MITACSNCADLAARVEALEAQLDRAREALRAAGMTGDLANVADAVVQLALSGMLTRADFLAARATIGRMLAAARDAARSYADCHCEDAVRATRNAVERAAKERP